MSSQSRSNEFPRASAILAGLGLAAQLTAAATDGIPVAKLVVGVVSRIVTLAEDIEKRRTALHALADTARITGESIKDVLDHGEPGEQIERSLEGLHTVFRAIEALFAKHKAKNAFFRALSYALTTAAHIDALNQELSRAAQQFAVVATLDTHTRVQEANTRLQETNDRLQDAKADIRELQIRLQQNSVYNGNLRNLHDCDVDKLELITEDAPPWHRYSIKYYTARVETSGSIMVLRYIEPNAQFDSKKYSGNDYVLRTVARHDRILEQFSKVPHSHRNIARIYGVSQGGPLSRFTVMKAGYIPVSAYKRQAPSTDQTWEWIRQLVDAACYLNDNGLCWDPDLSNPFFFDAANIPIIGLNNDFRPASGYCGEPVYVFQTMLEHAYSAHWEQSQPRKHALDVSFGTALVPEGIYKEKITVPRRLIPTLDAKICTYITNALQSLEDPWDVWAHTGAVILHASASGCNVGSTFYTKYFTNCTGPFDDNIFMARVDESDTELVHWTVMADVPTSMAGTLRKRLGIMEEGPPNHMDILESHRDPVEPGSMRFTSRYP